MIEVLVPALLLCNGMAAGVLIGTLLGGWPLLDTLAAPEYVAAHAFFSTRYDPFMPICLLVTVLADGLLAAFAVTGAGRVPFALAGLLAAGTVAISFRKNVPINKWVQQLDPANLPEDFAERDPRRYWGKWNHARVVLTVSALVGNCVGLGLLL